MPKGQGLVISGLVLAGVGAIQLAVVLSNAAPVLTGQVRLVEYAQFMVEAAVQVHAMLFVILLVVAAILIFFGKKAMHGAQQTSGMVTPSWVAAVECVNSAQAQVVASQFEAGGVPARVENHGAVPGLESGSTVLVPSDVLHRARWLFEQSKVTEAELTYLATGTLPGDNGQ